MAVQDKAGLKAQSDSTFTDNVAGDITPVNHRAFNTDDIDSALNIGELSQQTVLGAVNYTGGLSVDGNLIDAPDNVVIVNSLADFPTPNGSAEIDLYDGVGNTTYVIGVTEIDISPNKFIQTGGVITIVGNSQSGSRITTTATGTIFTTTVGSLKIDNFYLNAPNADIFDFTGDNFTAALLVYGVIIRSCLSLGTVEGSASVVLNRAVVLETSVAGLLFVGTNGQFLMIGSNFGLQSGFLGWTGSAIDFGTATFSIIDIATGTRFFTKSGNTAITGAAASANLLATGRGKVSGNLFVGDGAYLNGMNEQDLGYKYSSNDGLSDSVADARITSIGNVLVTDTTAGAAQINAVFTEDHANKHTTTAAGVITYVGSDDITGVPIDIICSVEPNSGTNQTIAMWIAKGNDGTGSLPIAALAIDTTTRQEVRADSNDPQTMVTGGQYTEEKGSIFAVFVENETSGANSVIVSNPKIRLN
jgi:hypothetical protein